MNLYDQILTTPCPSRRAGNLRLEHRKERAKRVRRLFTEIGLKGISVTAPNYSMAQSIDIRLPDNECLRKDRDNPCPGCSECKRSKEAKQKLEQIILAAFPELDDRSDTNSDHFDYCLSIH